MGHGLISQDIIKQIKEQIDIVEVVSGYVSLTKAGQNLKGLCPFHAEKTPSFTVSPARQMFHCFGCGVGGDVFAFVMKRENLGFVESVQELSRKTRVTIPQVEGRSDSWTRPGNERLYALHEEAGNWFHKNLVSAPGETQARDYLASRGIRQETIETFQLGWALPGWDGLIREMTRKGFNAQELATAGLVVQKDKGVGQTPSNHSCYDRFRKRIIFPILNPRKRVVAFGGRLLDDGVPKYLNSSDTPIFRKGTTLYGMERARSVAAQQGTLIIVEGYFDVIVLVQAGIHNVVATLGTALTQEHVRSMERVASNVVLLFDADPAGVRAAIRTLDLFQGSGLGVRVVSLPSGEDPDSFVRRDGVEAFRHLEESAPSLVEFAVNQSLQSVQSGRLDDRIRSVDGILRILQKSNNRIEKEECLRYIAERLGVSQHLLTQRYPELVKRQTANPTSAPGEARVQPQPADPSWERDVVRFLLQDRLSLSQVRRLDPDAFSVERFRTIVEKVLNQIEFRSGEYKPLDVEALEFDSDCQGVVRGLLLAEEHYDDLTAYIQGCLETLERKHYETKFRALITRLRDAEREGRWDDVNRLNAQVHKLSQQKSRRDAEVPIN